MNLSKICGILMVLIAFMMASCTVETGEPVNEPVDTVEQEVVTTSAWTDAPTNPTSTDLDAYGSTVFAQGSLGSTSDPAILNMVAVHGVHHMMMHQQFEDDGSTVEQAWSFVPSSPTFKTSDAFNINGGAALTVAVASWPRPRFVIFGVDRISGYVKYIVREKNTSGNWVWGSWYTLTELGTVQSIGIEHPVSSSPEFATLVARNTSGALVYATIRTSMAVPYTNSAYSFFGPWALNTYTYPGDQISNPVVMHNSSGEYVYYLRTPNRSFYSYLYQGTRTSNGGACNSSNNLGGTQCWSWSIIPKPTASGTWKKFNTSSWNVNGTTEVCQVAAYQPFGGSQQLYKRCSIGGSLSVFGMWNTFGAMGNWDYSLPMVGRFGGPATLRSRLWVYESHRSLFPSNLYKQVRTLTDSI